jgi:ribonuclease HII
MYNEIMKKGPTLNKEKELWTVGHEYIGGIDEAGRGAWAGPVVAAVVVLPKNHRRIKDVDDSKLISPEKRAILYGKITERAVDFGVGIVSHEIITEVGILEATKLAAKEALEMLQNKPTYLLTDFLKLEKHTDIPHEAIVDGDAQIYSISCASIIAKVTRDNIMSALGGDYKKYEFKKHKGYGTKRHQELLAAYGPCDIHRRSFAPIKELLK